MPNFTIGDLVRTPGGKPTKEEIELAKAIASDLFLAGCGQRADTLKLYTSGFNGLYLGGWSEAAAADRIASVIAGFKSALDREVQ